MLNIADQMSVENLNQKLVEGGTSAQYNTEFELNSIARNAITEYRVNI